MRAVVVTKPGPLPESVSIATVPDLPPTVAHGVVRVRVQLVGLNYYDVAQASGGYPLDAYPTKLCIDAAGVVDAVGEGVSNVKKGQRVCVYYHQIGAEVIDVPSSSVFPIPDTLSLDIALSLTTQGMTAILLLTKSYRLAKGDSVLIHAGAGGVGQIVIQLARHLGAAAIIATASTPEKRKLCTDLGATLALPLTDPDFTAKVKAAVPDGKGVHCVVDGIGKDSLAASLSVIRHAGAFLSYGCASGKLAAANFTVEMLIPSQAHLSRPLLPKWGSELPGFFALACKLVQEGVIVIQKPTEYPLEAAGQALHDLFSRKTVGKLVLRV